MNELQPVPATFLFETARLEADELQLSYDLAGKAAVDRLFHAAVLVCRVRPIVAVETYGADRNFLRTLHHVIEHGVFGKRLVALPYEPDDWAPFVLKHLPEPTDPTDDVYFIAGDVLKELEDRQAGVLLGKLEAIEAELAWPPHAMRPSERAPLTGSFFEHADLVGRIFSTNLEPQPVAVEVLGSWPDASASTAADADAPSADAQLAAARARRDALLNERQWWTSEDVAMHARGRLVDSNPSQYASRLRTEKRIFGVRFRGKYLHPAFQFTASGDPLPAIGALLQKLPTSDANWSAAFWLFQPHGALSGRCPADVLTTDAVAVLAAADKDFGNDARV